MVAHVTITVRHVTMTMSGTARLRAPSGTIPEITGLALTTLSETWPRTRGPSTVPTGTQVATTAPRGTLDPNMVHRGTTGVYPGPIEEISAACLVRTEVILGRPIHLNVLSLDHNTGHRETSAACQGDTETQIEAPNTAISQDNPGNQDTLHLHDLLIAPSQNDLIVSALDNCVYSYTQL